MDLSIHHHEVHEGTCRELTQTHTMHTPWASSDKFMHQMAHQKRRKCTRVIKLKLRETSRPTAQRDRSPRVMGATFFWIASRSVLIIQCRWPWESSDYYAVPMAEVNSAGSQGVLLLCNETATSLIVVYFLLQISSLNFCLLFFHCNLQGKRLRVVDLELSAWPCLSAHVQWAAGRGCTHRQQTVVGGGCRSAGCMWGDLGGSGRRGMLQVNTSR